MSAAPSSDTIVEIGLACSCFSIIGTLYITISYLAIPTINSIPAFRLTFHLGLMDFFLTINGIYTLIFLPSTLNPTFCEVWGALHMFTAQSSFFWPIVIAYVLYQFHRGVYKTPTSITANFNKYYWFSYAFPIVFVIIPLFWGSNGYGNSGIFCWINDSTGDTFYLLAFICFYGPCFIFGMMIIYWYCSMLRSTLRHSEQANQMILYPFFFVLLVVVSALDRFQGIFGLTAPSFLTVIHLGVRQLQGFLNFLAYGCNKQIRAAIRAHFRKDTETPNIEKEMSVSIMKGPSLKNSFNADLTMVSMSSSI